MAKYRSKTDYAQIYAADRHGDNVGLDGSIYIKRETTARVFNPPAIGTQGSSIGDTAASDDISAHASPCTLKAEVHGGAIVTASFATAGLTTGALIAAALETALNTALAAAGQDYRVWVDFDIGDDHYEVYDQTTGTASAVVITDGVSNNIADDLKLGVANGGTEAVGTDDADFLLHSTGGATFSQPIEPNAHRSGRFHSGIIKKKKVVEHDLDTYVNMSGSAGASLDTAVMLLIESACGKKTVNAGVSIDFTQDLPVILFSLVRVSTIFGEYQTGHYVKDMTITFPGSGPATVKYAGKGADSAVAGLAQLNGAVAASTSVITNTGESKRYTVGGRVMMVGVDGRTITAGADGALYVASTNHGAHTLVLNTAVTAADDSYIVPWDPGAVQKTARDNIYTDLVGSAKINASAAAVDITNFELSLKNDHNDRDGVFGADGNRGFIAGNRLTAEMKIDFDLSNETFGDVVQAREFGGFSPEIVLGSVASGRYLKITAPNWKPAVPVVELPENGPTPVSLVGNLLESSPGARDPFKLLYG